ncbi:CHAT domain-containing protein [Bradyrhizobium genosp. L]|uniref:CHAT domain-containing protein n=1 Tax=Bradyrhizobium genosp. L TaxID=83637 RepID=UPI0018A2FCB4|nr:CHAT domain-containing protein [Bradyrhizobium genosp. L]QPF86585.1 CHAT domain-containing protein [Bradyrhizobium genosp. L]
MSLEWIALTVVGLLVSHTSAALLGSTIKDFFRNRLQKKPTVVLRSKIGGRDTFKFDHWVSDLPHDLAKQLETLGTDFLIKKDGPDPDLLDGAPPKAPVVPKLKPRTIDANFVTEKFEPGAVGTLTITIRLPTSAVKGKWQGQALLQPDGGAIDVILETQGFTLVSERPPPVEVSDERDTPPMAFELRIEESNPRWIHVLLVQGGSPVGELTINDFSQLGADAAHRASTDFRPSSEADLTLVIRSTDGRIEVSSPRGRASLDHVTISGFRYPQMPFRKLLAGRLKDLYDSKSNPEDTEREMKLVGAELAGCLPPDLIKLLRRDDIKSIMLRHEEDFDFPLELVFLDDAKDPFFIGDRIAICRWFLGVTNPPDIVAKKLARVAFLKGTDAAFAADERLLQGLFGQQAETFGARGEVVEKIFKTANFDLIHFTGHCRQKDDTQGGLELADGSFLRLGDVGQLEAERKFAASYPFVLLNACASATPFLGLTQRDSFGHRFVMSQACAVVGTLWPVSGPIANDFAQRFYAALSAETIGRALLTAKKALADGTDAGGADERQKALRKLARQVAARSYCLFANPDLRVSGLKQLEKINVVS